MNEELRSTAEELETSKEELQSVNEELTTVNQELKIKIEELGLANNDFQNLINSTDIGTIFLDRRLRVKLFTPAASQVFNLLRSRHRTAAVGHHHRARPRPAVRRRRSASCDELRTVDAEYQTRDGRWILTRLRPYRTTDDRIDGVVDHAPGRQRPAQAEERAAPRRRAAPPADRRRASITRSSP